MTRISESDMKLPSGYTCSDCRDFNRCRQFNGRKGTETECDWSPSAFVYQPANIDGLIGQLAGSQRALTKALTELREAREENERLQAELEQIRADPQGIGDVLAAVGAWYEIAGKNLVGEDGAEQAALQAILDTYDKFLG